MKYNLKHESLSIPNQILYYKHKLIALEILLQV